MSIPLIGTYQFGASNQATSILVNVLGLPSQQGSAANITWDWTIQLGSGTQAFSPTLTSLAAPIANGTGPGQLSYGTLSVSYAGTTIFVSLTVTNITSSTVTVTEIGLNGTVYVDISNAYNYLLSYDTFSSPISIPGYGMAVFQITLSFTG
jgi:hypothetical protein